MERSFRLLEKGRRGWSEDKTRRDIKDGGKQAAMLHPRDAVCVVFANRSIRLNPTIEKMCNVNDIREAQYNTVRYRVLTNSARYKLFIRNHRIVKF